jgi:hypothetical protein
MDESAPAPAEQDENAAPEETAAQEKPAREHRRPRVPTSVLVTVLVAAFSVWVAPAFARQWDDRQKARELQAALAQDVAASTATAIGDAVAVLAGAESRDATALARKWDTARSRLEATLRAYYPLSVISQWYETSENIADLHRIAPDVRESLLFAEGKPRYNHEGILADYLRDLFYEPAWDYYEPPPGDYERGIDLSAKYAKWVFDARVVEDPVDRLGRLLRRMFAQRVNTTLRDVLETTPQGFSTTRGDLLRDLLP